MGLRHLPAYEASMGVGNDKVNYFLAKMSVAEFLDIVKLSKEVTNYEDSSKTLSDKLQRGINESRSKKEIAKYLALTEDRFMPSFVVAVFDSNPKFRNVKLDASDNLTSVMIEDGQADSFGILSLKDDGKYFVLDGQHRLSALRFLDSKSYKTDKKFQKTTESWDPIDLEKDELSILFLANQEIDNGSGKIDEKKFKSQARKIFTVINRHAKPTTTEDNIMMDETDIAAIITRDLIEKHDKAKGVFYWDGKNEDTKRVHTDSSSLRSGSQYLTTLSGIYEMNRAFIGEKGIFQWNDDEIEFCFDKTKEQIDEVKETLDVIWDEMISAFSFWKDSDPSLMKSHIHPDDRERGDKAMDHLLFWPVGQIAVAKYLAQEMGKFVDEDRDSGLILLKDIRKTIKKLDKVNWDLFSGPWKGIVLHQKAVDVDPQGRKAPTKFKWTMPASGAAHKVIQNYLLFLTGVEYDTKDLTYELRQTWDSSIVLYRPQQKELDALWREILKHRETVSGIK